MRACQRRDLGIPNGDKGQSGVESDWHADGHTHSNNAANADRVANSKNNKYASCHVHSCSWWHAYECSHTGARIVYSYP